MTRRASPCSRTAASPPPSAPESSSTWTRNCPNGHCRPPSPASATPAGPHGGPTDVNAHPHLDNAGRVAVVPQRHHRELRAAAGRVGGARPRTGLRDRHRGRRPPARRGVLRLRRPRRGDAAGVPAPGGRVHAGRGARGRAGRGRGRAPQLAARGGRGGGRVLPRLGRRGLHRPHPGRHRTGPGPGRRAAAGRCDGHRLRRHPGRRPLPTTSTGTPRPPRRAATTTSCSRRSPSSRRRSPTPCWAASTAPAR